MILSNKKLTFAIIKYTQKTKVFKFIYYKDTFF